jgi:hypothetical protein
MNRLISLSIPRSGHHLLVRLLHCYLEHGKFLYCEMYTERECCGRVPCEAVSRRAKDVFGSDSRLRLFMQKSHDLSLEVPVEAATRYIVQLRDPAQAAIALLRWEMTYGARDNFSLGEIPSKVFDFFCYYIRFYHKWCMSVILGSKEMGAHMIHYESLVSSRQATRKAVLDLLDWLNLPIDDFRLEYCLDNSLNSDAHTGESRSQDAEIREIEYYDRLCGGSFAFLLDKVVALCPGLPAKKCTVDKRCTVAESADQRMGDLFFPLDLSCTSDAVLEFTASDRQLEQDSLAVRSGYPSMSRALGLAYGEKGSGAWTIGDNVIFPFRISASHQTLQGQIVVVDADGRFNLSELITLTVVVQGSLIPVGTSFSRGQGRTILTFNCVAPGSTSFTSRVSALILSIARPRNGANGFARCVNLLLESLSLSSGHTRESTHSKTCVEMG